MNKQNPILCIFKRREIRYQDILKTLKKSGVKKGDIIFIHSDLSAFGKIGEVRDRDEFMGLILKVFKDIVGEEGTIVMPTFTYSFCKNKIYDINFSPSSVGVLTEYFRKQKEVIRTAHPIFSVAIWGKEKRFFNSNLSKDSFDQDSIFGKLHKKNAKIVFFGAPFQSCTFIHYIEQSFSVPYRYSKTFGGKIKIGSQVYKDKYEYFVRPLDNDVNVDLDRFKNYLFEEKLIKLTKLGGGEILTIDANTLFRAGIKMLKKNIYFFLKNRPK